MFLPVAALPSAEFPVINVSAQLPGASPETMATSVATPLIKQFATIAGIDTHLDHQLARLDLDRHPVRAQPRHRRGGGRRAGGDRAHAARAAARDDQPAELPEGQSGRRADPAAGADERHRAAHRSRRLRPARDLAVALDASTASRRWRSSAARNLPCASRSIRRRLPRAASRSTSSRTRSPPPTATRRSARCRTASSN